MSPKGKLNTVLVLYTTPVWTFSRLQDDVNSQRRELFLKIDFSTDTTIVLAVLYKALLKSLNKLPSIKYGSQFIVASLNMHPSYRSILKSLIGILGRRQRLQRDQYK